MFFQEINLTPAHKSGHSLTYSYPKIKLILLIEEFEEMSRRDASSVHSGSTYRDFQRFSENSESKSHTTMDRSQLFIDRDDIKVTIKDQMPRNSMQLKF